MIANWNRPGGGVRRQVNPNPRHLPREHPRLHPPLNNINPPPSSSSSQQQPGKGILSKPTNPTTDAPDSQESQSQSQQTRKERKTVTFEPDTAEEPEILYKKRRMLAKLEEKEREREGEGGMGGEVVVGPPPAPDPGMVIRRSGRRGRSQTPEGGK